MSGIKTEKIVYIVRHGQSEDNVAPVFQSPDSPLNEKGRRQAQSIAHRVAKLPFQAIITSPFPRAKETAQIIADVTGRPLEHSELFVERIKPAYIGGKPHSDKKADTLWRKWDKTLYAPGARVEDGENFDDLMIRAEKALAYLRDREEKTLVVVTHGFFLRTIVARVLLGDALTGESFRRFQKATLTENTGLTALRCEGGFEEEPRWRLWIYNDHAHLAE